MRDQSGGKALHRSTAPLRDDVDENWALLSRDDRSRTFEDASKLLRVGHRPNAFDIESAGDAREIGLGIFDKNAHALVLDVAAALAGDVLLVALVVPVGAVVIDDRQERQVLASRGPQGLGRVEEIAV